jgi:hypothetical protein
MDLEVIKVSKEVNDKMFFRLIESECLEAFWSIEPQDLIRTSLNTSSVNSTQFCYRILGRVSSDISAIISDIKIAKSRVTQYNDTFIPAMYNKSSSLWANNDLKATIGTVFYIYNILLEKPIWLNYETMKEQVLYLKEVGAI